MILIAKGVGGTLEHGSGGDMQISLTSGQATSSSLGPGDTELIPQHLSCSCPSATCSFRPPTKWVLLMESAQKEKNPPSNKESYNYFAAPCPW